MPCYKRITVKIGSNVLTRPDGTLDVTRISALVDQIADLRRRNIEVILVSSGAVASGRSELGIEHNRRLDAVSARQLFSAVGQAKLINRYYELFREHGIACGQVLTMKENFATRRHYLNQKHCMEVMLENGVIPIVNENDTVAVDELEGRNFGDNDTLSAIVAGIINADVLMILTDIDGVYDKNPKAYPDAKRLSVIEKIDDEVRAMAGGAGSARGTGGMATKIRAAEIAGRANIPTYILSGEDPENLYRIFDGEDIGTVFMP